MTFEGCVLIVSVLCSRIDFLMYGFGMIRVVVYFRVISSAFEFLSILHVAFNLITKYTFGI